MYYGVSKLQNKTPLLHQVTKQFGTRSNRILPICSLMYTHPTLERQIICLSNYQNIIVQEAES